MKNRSLISGLLTAGCAVGVALPQLTAGVTDQQFEELQNLVKQLAGKVEKLEQVHQQDQQTHQQDLKTIQHLQEQVGETQKLATNAVQKAEAAAQARPTVPIPEPTIRASHNVTLAGDAEVQYGKTDGQHGGFLFADFAPIFLYRANDNVLFEAGFDFTLANGAMSLSLPNGQTITGNSGTSYLFDLSFAQLDYLWNDYLSLVAGEMLLPLGTYSERSAGWLNKFPDNPMARSIVPAAGTGVQLRGVVPIGQSGQSITYSVYGVNGPSSTDGTGNSGSLDLNGNVGILNTPSGTTAMGNLHSSPSGGGRLGWFFPLKPHYDLELGVSGQTGTWDNANSLMWSAAAFDAALHVSPYFEAKGEYLYTWVETSDLGTVIPRGWWAQAGYKLAGLGLELPVINSLELVGRYDTLNTGLGTATDRYSVGCVYYITNTLLFETDYEFLHSNDPTTPHHQLTLQLSYGF